MSILIKSGEEYYEIGGETLEKCAIGPDDYEVKRMDAEVADRGLSWDAYADAVEIGCGCCMNKKSLFASCL